MISEHRKRPVIQNLPQLQNREKPKRSFEQEAGLQKFHQRLLCSAVSSAAALARFSVAITSLLLAIGLEEETGFEDVVVSDDFSIDGCPTEPILTPGMNPPEMETKSDETWKSCKNWKWEFQEILLKKPS